MKFVALSMSKLKRDTIIRRYRDLCVQDSAIGRGICDELLALRKRIKEMSNNIPEKELKKLYEK